VLEVAIQTVLQELLTQAVEAVVAVVALLEELVVQVWLY
jgi:hypothetical protein